MTLVRPDFPRVLFVSGCGGATGRYRVFHHHEQLRLVGVRSRVIQQGHPGLVDAGLGCGIVILHRTAMDGDIQALIEQTRRTGGICLFDIDDLVFAPELTAFHRGVAHLSADETALYHDGVQRYRRCLLACDGAIVPTAYLAERVRELGRPAWISRNCLGADMMRLSVEARARRLASRANGDGRIVVGYASGSRTHDWDFSEAAGPALLDVMSGRPDVALHLVGPLELDQAWSGLADRVQQTGFVDWRALPELMAGWDISLAPLEHDNPFCRSKSELKWFEAAACGLPSVAVATEAFAAAIDNGRTGLLATTVDEWIAALELLIGEAGKRRAIGNAAFEDVGVHRTTAAQAPAYVAMLAEARGQLAAARPVRQRRANPGVVDRGVTGQTVADPSPERPLKVSFLIPEPIQGSGGHISIFRMATALQKAGHQVTMCVDRGALFAEATDAELVDYCRRHFPPATMALRLGRDLGPADVAVATGWTTASVVACADGVRSRAYFVQDFEPYFQPRGTDYALAEMTYQMGLKHITLGPWLSGLLADRYGAWAKPIGFGVEHDLYHPRSDSVSSEPDGTPNSVAPVSRRPRIVFYARPSTPRRGTELGLEALGLVKTARPEVEIVLFGNDRPIDPGYEVTHGGILAPEGLAELYRSATAGLVLSYTNLSFVPFEMMACGCPVVAVATDPVAWFFRDGENAVLCASTAEAIAEATLKLLDSPSLHEDLVRHGLADVAQLTWEANERRFVAYVEAIAQEAEQATASRWPVAAELDQLVVQPETTETPGPIHAVVPLRPGDRCGWQVRCGSDHLYRVDVRFACPVFPKAAPITMSLREHALATDDLVQVHVDADLVIDGEWLAFEFQPLAASRGRDVYLELSLPAEARDVGLAVHQGDFRTWCLDPGVLGTEYSQSAPTVADPALAYRLALAERSRAATEVAKARFTQQRLFPLLDRWSRLGRPMPPPALRPWPDSAPMPAKLAAGLKHYGLLATLREVIDYWRWRSQP